MNQFSGSRESSLGLVVTAKQTYYPIELSNAELLAHYETVQDYHQEISLNCITQSCRLKPDSKLIDQQPELGPSKTRHVVVNFFFELALKTRVTNGIFYQAVRLYDRYCSKRIVLREQVKLVVATCLWLAAKTWGGCNHIINNVSVPTGGRFYGPNPRARIPRLSELIHLCNDSQTFDESMFTQMERHILNTLGWEIYEPMINDYILNADENCAIQYELYRRQLEHNRKWLNRNKEESSSINKESDSTDDEDLQNEEENEDDEDLTQKIQLINIKKFLIDLTSWQYQLLKFEQFEVTHGMFQLINKFTNQELGPLLQTPIPTGSTSDAIVDIYIDAILDCPEQLWESYKEFDGIVQFVGEVRDYQRQMEYLSQQRQIQYSTPTRIYQVPSAQQNFPSPPYSQQTFSPSSRKISTQSDNSLFSTYGVTHSSPLTPQLHSFTHNKLTPNSANGSHISLHSTSSMKRSYDDKENIDPASMANFHKVNSYIVPPRAKFVGQSSSVFSSGGGSISNGNSNRSSLISLPLGNAVV